MAAHLALMGLEVTLYNRTFDHISAISARGGIDLESYEGGPHGFGELAAVTSDIKKAITGADMIMVVVPSSAHKDVSALMAPHLQDEQTIILHPGRTCGAIEVDKVLRDHQCQAEITVAETGNFYLCQPLRWPGPGAHLPR